jgi:hypothetical protein
VPASEDGMGARKLNQWLTSRESSAACRIWWMGRFAVLESAVADGLSSPFASIRLALGGPDQDCDVRSVAMLPGYSWAPKPSQRSSVNVGSDLVLPFPSGSRPGGGQAQCPLLIPDRGGVAVVLGGRESRSQGEGRQRFREEGMLQCRKTRR